MKNTFYLALSLLILSQTSFAQHYSSVDRVIINSTEVPQEVIRAQDQQFRDGFVIGWKMHTKNLRLEDDKEYYMANFKMQGRLGNYAYYTPDGMLLAYSLFVHGNDVPENIREYCLKNFNLSNIKFAELIDLENPQRFVYRIRLTAQGLMNYLYFDMNGNRLDKYKLPKEIFLFI